jgi:hypothetical protein
VHVKRSIGRMATKLYVHSTSRPPRNFCICIHIHIESCPPVAIKKLNQKTKRMPPYAKEPVVMNKTISIQ